jgi:2-phosphosulfolactate phosphatase
MRIEIVQGHDIRLPDARVNVVIDVIRAFTFAHVAFRRGASRILLARSVDEAFALKTDDPDLLLISGHRRAWAERARDLRSAEPELLLAGEVDGLGIPGFDYDNSPFRLLDADLTGRRLVQKTTNGVTAALNALNADEVLVTGLTNARATVSHIRRILTGEPDALVHLVASHPTSDEDVACAEYIRGQLDGTGVPGEDETAARVRGSAAARKFHDPAQPSFDPRDIRICEQFWEESFVMRVNAASPYPYIERVAV